MQNTKSTISPETIIKRVGYKTADGLGLGIFYTMDGEVVLDETAGKNVTPQFSEPIGRADSFGSLRAKFGWNKPTF